MTFPMTGLKPGDVIFWWNEELLIVVSVKHVNEDHVNITYLHPTRGLLNRLVLSKFSHACDVVLRG